MAARPALRTGLRALAWTGGALVAAVLAFLLAAWIGSSLPRNADWTEPAEGVEIMVGDNGVHTELVLPLVTPEKDWRETFPASHVPAADAPYTHVAVSWGEREVFLNTLTWADLTLSTAIGALIGGESLVHVAHYIRPAPGPDNRPLRLTRAQYARLVARIEAALAPAAQRTRHPGYAEYDVFYTARGQYDWRNTCNQWTSDTLGAAGVKTGRWTPFAGGVMKWVPEPI
ncbi:MAG TPA: DUF2459 domain-containing protein [Qipengyuania sp.]|nr:DUF2459 domain-containing protein [Qipengyuania sp.]